MTEIWNLKTLCRCCHAVGNFSNLNSPCDVMGSIELCSDLLKDIFGIQLHSPAFEVSHMICDKCIKHLKDGAIFKKQVMECELKFQEYCKNELIQHMDIKLEKNEEDTSFVVKTALVRENEEPTKKKRGENWSAEEKDILREMISQSRHIIENKCMKTSSNVKKAQEWKNIAKKLNELLGKNRSDGEVKLAWKRMKIAAKANLSAHRQHMNTGGGEKPKSLSQEDLAIMNIAPHYFEDTDSQTEDTDCDSDVVKSVGELKTPEDNTTAGPSTDFSPTITEPPPITMNSPPESNDEVVKDKMEQGTSNVNVLTSGTSTPREKEDICRKQSDKKGPQSIKEAMEETVKSNIDFKKKQLEMLEVEHQYNIRIAEMKIKRRELEIKILEKKNSSTY